MLSYLVPYPTQEFIVLLLEPVLLSIYYICLDFHCELVCLKHKLTQKYVIFRKLHIHNVL